MCKLLLSFSDFQTCAGYNIDLMARFLLHSDAKTGHIRATDLGTVSESA